MTVADVTKDVNEDIKPVDMKVGYIPEGLEPLSLEPGKVEEGIWQDPEEQKHWLDLCLVKVDTEAEFLIYDLQDKQEFELKNGERVLLGKEMRSGDDVYRGAIFYDRQGYIVEIYAGGISEEELKKVMESIVLEETTGKGTTVQNLARRADMVAEAEARAAEVAAMETPIDVKNIHKLQERFIQTRGYNFFADENKQGEFEINVEDVQVLESAVGIKREDVGLPAVYDTQFVDGAGNLVPYEREFGVRGDGVNTPVWTSSGKTQMVNRKLLSLKVRIKNQTGEAAGTYIQPTLAHLQEEDNVYKWFEESYR